MDVAALRFKKVHSGGRRRLSLSRVSEIGVSKLGRQSRVFMIPF